MDLATLAKRTPLLTALAVLSTWSHRTHNREITKHIIDLINNLSSEDAASAVKELWQPKSYIQGTKGCKLQLRIILTLTDDWSLETNALLNSGSTGSCINRKYVEEHDIPTRKLPIPIPVYNALSINWMAQLLKLLIYVSQSKIIRKKSHLQYSTGEKATSSLDTNGWRNTTQPSTGRTRHSPSIDATHVHSSLIYMISTPRETVYRKRTTKKPSNWKKENTSMPLTSTHTSKKKKLHFPAWKVTYM